MLNKKVWGTLKRLNLISQLLKAGRQVAGEAPMTAPGNTLDKSAGACKIK
jgi:hypothetical protein